jgi:hypothetical protein
MKYFSLCLAVGALLLLSTRAGADTIISGTLTGSQEVPPTLSPAVGTFLGTLDLSASAATLSFTISYTELIGGTVVGASFHDAPAGMVGPDVREYDPALFASPDGTFTGTWTSADAQPLTPALVGDLLAGNIYFDIQTQEFPTGEIRGQLGVITPAPSNLCLALIGAAALAALACLQRWRESRSYLPSGGRSLMPLTKGRLLAIGGLGQLRPVLKVFPLGGQSVAARPGSRGAGRGS